MQEYSLVCGHITPLTYARGEMPSPKTKFETGTCARCKRSLYINRLHKIGDTTLLLCDNCLAEVLG